MKKNRLLAGLASAVMMCSLVSAMPASANFTGFVDRSSITDVRAGYSEKYTAAPELLGILDVMPASQGSYTGVYVTRTEKNLTGIIAEMKYYDTVSYVVNADDATLSAIAAEVEARFNTDSSAPAVKTLFTGNIVWQDKETSRLTEKPGIRFRFTGSDSGENIALADQIGEYIDANYDLRRADGLFDKYTYEIGYINWESFSTAGELTDGQIASINAYLAEQGINAEISSGGDNLVFDMGEDVTTAQKAAAASYMKENYGSYPEVFFQASAAEQPGAVVYSYEKEIDYPAGDANCDEKVDIADAVAIMQYLSNPEKYPLSEKGYKNADIDGNGVTGLDALAIQKIEAGSAK